MVNNHIRDDIIIIAILSVIIVYTIVFPSISKRLVSRNAGAFLAKGVRHTTNLAPLNAPCKYQYKPPLPEGWGLLRISSDRDDRRIFLGLKFSILGSFLVAGYKWVFFFGYSVDII